jgi:hypothetical protein
MALQDFWINVRTGSGLRTPEYVGDSSPIDAGTIEGSLRRQDRWLTPRAVGGFNEADLTFLSDEERSRMARLVAEFRNVTANVSPAVPTPAHVKEAALPIFRDLIQMLEFDRYGDPEAYRLGKQIENELRPHWPPELAELRFHTRLDHTGDPGLWIWVFLTEEVSREDKTFLEAVTRLRRILDSIARYVAPDRFPYLSFRAIKEPADLVAEEA